MGCYQIHELLNKTNSIFRSYLGEFCFLTVLVVAVGSQGDFWWLWGWQETVIGTHDPFGFSLALSNGWVLRSALFVLVSWSTWISGLRWVSLKSWGFHLEPLPIAWVQPRVHLLRSAGSEPCPTLESAVCEHLRPSLGQVVHRDCGTNSLVTTGVHNAVFLVTVGFC